MLTTGHNQYLQPDYLSPLPTTVSIRTSEELLLPLKRCFKFAQLITEKRRYCRSFVTLVCFAFFLFFSIYKLKLSSSY